MPGFFQRLFRKRKTSPQSNLVDSSTDQPTQPLSKPLAETTAEETPAEKTLRKKAAGDKLLDQSLLKPPQLIVGIGHSAGMQRDHNEDALFALTSNLISDETYLPFGLYIVADGMGGHKHGEIASGIAVRAMASHVIHEIYSPLISLPPTKSSESVQEVMRKGIQAAHLAILKQTPGGGTTLTGVLVLGDQMTIAHVGDSRAYILHPDGRIQVLTRDHSLVKRLVELGQITSAEAAVHPQRNVLYRALGQGEPIDAEIITTPSPKSGYVLLCSDGLWGVVAEQEVFDLVTSAPSPAQACQSLVAAANAAGGPDNITAVLIHLPD